MDRSEKSRPLKPELQVVWDLLDFLDEKLLGLPYEVYLDNWKQRRCFNIYVGPLGESFLSGLIIKGCQDLIRDAPFKLRARKVLKGDRHHGPGNEAGVPGMVYGRLTLRLSWGLSKWADRTLLRSGWLGSDLRRQLERALFPPYTFVFGRKHQIQTGDYQMVVGSNNRNTLAVYTGDLWVPVRDEDFTVSSSAEVKISE